MNGFYNEVTLGSSSVNSSTLRPYTVYLSNENTETVTQNSNTCLVNLIPPIVGESVGSVFEVALKSFAYKNTAIEINNLNDTFSFAAVYEELYNTGTPVELKKNESIKIPHGSYTGESLVDALNQAVALFNANLTYQLYTPNIWASLQYAKAGGDADEVANLEMLTRYINNSLGRGWVNDEPTGTTDTFEASVIEFMDVIREKILNSLPVFGANIYSYDPTMLLNRYWRLYMTTNDYDYEQDIHYIPSSLELIRENNHTLFRVQRFVNTENSYYDAILNPDDDQDADFLLFLTTFQDRESSMKTEERGVLPILADLTQFNNSNDAKNTTIIGERTGYMRLKSMEIQITDRSINLMRVLGFVKKNLFLQGSSLTPKSILFSQDTVAFVNEEKGEIKTGMENSLLYLVQEDYKLSIFSPFMLKRARTDFLDIFCRDMKSTSYSSVSALGLTKNSLIARIPYKPSNSIQGGEDIFYSPTHLSSFYHKADSINKIQIEILDDLGRPFNFDYSAWYMELSIQSRKDMGDINSTKPKSNTITPPVLSTYLENTASSYNKMRSKRGLPVKSEEAEKLVNKKKNRAKHKKEKKSSFGTIGGTGYDAETGDFSFMGDSYADNGVYEGEAYDNEDPDQIEQNGNLDAVEEMRQYVENGIKKQKRQFV